MVSCKACGKLEEELGDGLLMQRCTGCFAVSYCNAGCQMTHLSYHRVFCMERAAEIAAEHTKRHSLVPPGFNSAVLLHAAQAGDALAMVNLGLCYEHGKGGVDMDDAEAVRWYKRAVAVQKPQMEAYTHLADCYRRGDGVRKNLSEAARLFRIAAEGGGDAFAKVRLGDCLQRGQGVPYNPEEGVKWFQSAAAAGDPSALVKIGDAYLDGHGVPPNTAISTASFRRAADEGSYSLAMYRLGWYYSSVSATRDMPRAVAWYTRASNMGYQPAAAALDELSPYLTTEERTAADNLLREFASHNMKQQRERAMLAPSVGADVSNRAPWLRVTPPTHGDVLTMGTAALKRYLLTTGVDISGINEKGTLVRLALVGAAP